MILEYWKEFLNDPKIMEYGIKFCRDSAICTISKGFQKDIRYSSFICKRSQIDAILHKEYNLDEVEGLFIDWLFPYHKKQQIVEIELYSR